MLKPQAPHAGMPRPRGEPLYALAMIGACWIGVRVVMLGAGEDPRAVRLLEKRVPASAPSPRADALYDQALVAPPSLDRLPLLRSTGTGATPSLLSIQRPAPRRAAMPVFPHLLSGGHGLLLPATAEQPGTFRPARAVAAPLAPPPAAAHEVSRWSGGGWLLLRRGQSAAALATGASSYGGSQFGAVIRYNLAPAAALRPQVYLRVSGAIHAPFRDRQAALGLAVRPLSAVPIALLAEARAQQGTSSTHLRPAVALVSEVPPLRLPMGAEGEVYGQVGWVGGRDATGFFDLQATADRSVLRPLASADLRAGAGVWSGGQRGAARLDIGPRLTLRGKVAGTPARLAFDWRFRVAGNAEPGSGPALTFSAGF